MDIILRNSRWGSTDDGLDHGEQRGTHRRGETEYFIDSNSWAFQSCGRVPELIPRLPSVQYPLPGRLPISRLSTRVWHTLTHSSPR
jgi:hypothetical protein